MFGYFKMSATRAIASGTWRSASGSLSFDQPWSGGPVGTSSRVTVDRALVMTGSPGAGGPGPSSAPGAGPGGVGQVVGTGRGVGAAAAEDVRAALVTVSAACRTWVRSPPAQPAT